MNRGPAKNKSLVTLTQQVEQRVVDALASGQMHKKMMCDQLDLPYHYIDTACSSLKAAGRIVVLGNVRDAGYAGVKRGDLPVYGLPGTALQRVDVAEQRPVVEYPEDIRVAQKRTVPGYHFGWKGGPF